MTNQFWHRQRSSLLSLGALAAVVALPIACAPDPASPVGQTPYPPGSAPPYGAPPPGYGTPPPGYGAAPPPGYGPTPAPYGSAQPGAPGPLGPIVTTDPNQ